jgi:hypothetical protein
VKQILRKENLQRIYLRGEYGPNEGVGTVEDSGDKRKVTRVGDVEVRFEEGDRWW